jgi:NADH-ubiquinone oxidoreductase chain 5
MGYMEGDPHQNRYYLFLNFFVATMILMVSADNLFVLFVGWEGVGLASYFLINFWFTRIYANLAGIKAFLFNRVGDWGLTLGLIFYFFVYGGLALDMQNLPRNGLDLVGMAILLGAITKSAQIGLHSWLSRSMEGPTPVSALLHAATMVTAGVYLMLRMNLILEWSSSLLLIICWIGGLSALSGAIGGLAEQDIKKIIAYSTISQLGYMFIAIGISQYNLSLWHLINHACFKALLFLSAGALIHS